jgi:hypothetical protein
VSFCSKNTSTISTIPKLDFRMRLFLLLSFLFYTAGISAQVVSDKLEAYFSFGTCKAIDDSGNGSSGALKGGIGCACGPRDSAMYFVDNDDALNLVGPLRRCVQHQRFHGEFLFPPHPTKQSAERLAIGDGQAGFL